MASTATSMRQTDCTRYFAKCKWAEIFVTLWSYFSCQVIDDRDPLCRPFCRFFPQVMDTHLKDHEWLAADQYTIADIANFTWVFIHTWSGKECRTQDIML